MRPDRTVAGLRIRQHRKALGLTQAALAERAGISPSYLNLIESNRRAIAGRVLISIARELGLSPTDLSDAPERALIGDLREAALQRGETDTSPEELIGRYPGWARTLAATHNDNRNLRRAVVALSDRLTHDPFLAGRMHTILTNITALKSTADILADTSDMSEAQRQRFFGIMTEESARLTAAAQELVSYFDRDPGDARASLSPEEALDRFLDAHDHVFPDLEAGSPRDAMADLLNHPTLDSDPARILARTALTQYVSDAQIMPLGQFYQDARNCGYDPDRLEQIYDSGYPAVFRRLSRLRRPGIDAPAMAALQLGQSGNVVFRRAQPVVPLPRHGTACPLWPVFAAFTQPGRPLRAVCTLPDDSEVCVLAMAEPVSAARFDRPAVMEAAMLIVPAIGWEGTIFGTNGVRSPVPVGPGCHLCPREACDARITASILG